MSELITLRKGDPNFERYLLGTFSKSHRALPVTSLNVNSDSEQITFEILPKAEIRKPVALIYLIQLLKLKNFILVIFPLFLILVKNLLDETITDAKTGLFSFLGVLCLHAAANLRNDYMDHMRGLDRVHPTSGSRAIQRGWIRAISVQRLAYLFLVFGVVFGLPAIIKYTEIQILVAFVALLGLLGLGSYRMGLRYRRWSELTVFLVLGALLTCGFQVSLGAGYDQEAMAIGIVTGWFAVFYLHLKNFDQLMVNSQAKFNNTVSWLGFEKSKNLLFFWWIIFLVLFNGYHILFASNYWAWIIGVGSCLSSFAFMTSVKSLHSPVGSGMRQLLRQGRYLVLFNLCLWFLENLWYLWIVERWN